MRISVVLDCCDAKALSSFWAGALGYDTAWEYAGYVALSPRQGDGPVFILQTVPEPKRSKNRMHIDLHAEDLEAEEQRLIALGARKLEPKSLPEAGLRWTIMTDPEGNEFCIVGMPTGPQS